MTFYNYVIIHLVNSSVLHMCIYTHAGVLFTGKGKPVKDERGNPLFLKNGQPRVGKGIAESTFRKIYHALRTIHVHFQQKTDYMVHHKSLICGT